MLVVVPTSTGNAWRVAGNVEDDDLRDRREGEVGGVTVEDMKTMIWQTMIGLLDSMVYGLATGLFRFFLDLHW